MAAVLLGFAGLDALGEDAPAHPPGGELGQPAEGVGGTGHAVVGAEACGPPARCEHAGEDGLGLGHPGRSEGGTAEQKAAVAVGHGERSTIEPVARVDVARELGAPDLVGSQDQAGGLPRMATVATGSSLGHHARTAEDITNRGARGSRPAGMAFLEHCQPCLGAPRRVMLAPFDEGLDDVLGGLMGAGERVTRAILQTWWTGYARAVDPLVRRRTTDAVPCAHRSDRQRPSQVIGEEWGLLVPG